MVEVATGAIAVAAGALAYGARVPRSSMLAPTVWRGPVGSPGIALTFDDGPSESTLELLEILDHFDVPATFFQCGANVRRVPAMARAVAGAGHEIGNHSESHRLLSLRGAGFIRDEIETAQRTIADVTGVTPRVFRPPYGVRWFGLRAALRDLGLTGVMWSVIGLDWKLPAPGVERRLMESTRPGAIVCLHDGRSLQPQPNISVTLETLPRVIPQWKERGLQLMRVSELLCPMN